MARRREAETCRQMNRISFWLSSGRIEHSLNCMPLRRRHACWFLSIVQPHECCVAAKSTPADCTLRVRQQPAAFGLRPPGQAIIGYAEV